MAGMVATLAVDRAAMRRAAEEGFTTATAVADALVRRGVPFRAAHHVVGGLVAEAERTGIGLADLPDPAFAAALAASRDPAASSLAADPQIGAELRAAATIEAALASCDVVGGTAPGRVAAALALARERLAAP
jgi:argininosuccinate lyase